MVEDALFPLKAMTGCDSTMNRQLVVTRYKQGLLSCLYESDLLTEIMLEPENVPIRVGDIYIGKVMQIVPNINAAFVAFRPGLNGYYSLETNQLHLHTNRPPDQKLSGGDEILVQVSKENLKTKAWTLSSDISLTGDFVVLFYGSDQIKISSKITDEGSRERLRRLIENRQMSGSSYGITIRTAAAAADETEILEETAALSAEFDRLLAAARTRTCYSKIREADPEYMKLVRRYHHGELKLTTDIPAVYDRVSSVMKLSAQTLKLYEDHAWPLIKTYNIEAQLEKALASRVWMKSGAFLVIEQTEAMTVIDVNTGKNISRKTVDKQFLDVNIEAAKEICRQIRLRNLSGIIIVDFINMRDPEHIRLLMQTLKEEAAKDPVQLTVVDRTKLQLVEMTRKKIRRSLAQQLTL